MSNVFAKLAGLVRASRNAEGNVRPDNAINNIDNEAALFALATSDVVTETRRAATEKIQDQAFLAEIARKDRDWQVRQTAVRRLMDAKILTSLIEHEPARPVLASIYRNLRRQGAEGDLSAKLDLYNTCPRCNKACFAATAGGKPLCERCGWRASETPRWSQCLTDDEIAALLLRTDALPVSNRSTANLEKKIPIEAAASDEIQYYGERYLMKNTSAKAATLALIDHLETTTNNRPIHVGSTGSVQWIGGQVEVFYVDAYIVRPTPTSFDVFSYWIKMVRRSDAP